MGHNQLGDFFYSRGDLQARLRGRAGGGGGQRKLSRGQAATPRFRDPFRAARLCPSCQPWFLPRFHLCHGSNQAAVMLCCPCSPAERLQALHAHPGLLHHGAPHHPHVPAGWAGGRAARACRRSGLSCAARGACAAAGQGLATSRTLPGLLHPHNPLPSFTPLRCLGSCPVSTSPPPALRPLPSLISPPLPQPHPPTPPSLSLQWSGAASSWATTSTCPTMCRRRRRRPRRRLGAVRAWRARSHLDASPGWPHAPAASITPPLSPMCFSHVEHTPPPPTLFAHALALPLCRPTRL